MDPGDILQRAREHTREGRYEDALADFLWFHRNALEHERAYYGVRLSFALAYWKELAEVFPRAGEVLQAVRDEAASELLCGRGEARELFNDAAAIDHQLGRMNDTYKLFAELHGKDLARTSNYADIALPCVVEAGDWHLAMQIMPHPEQYLLGASDQLNENLTMKASSRAAAKVQRETFVDIYCEDVRLLLRVLEGVGRSEWASAASVWAVALVRDANFRSMVENELILKAG
jgi:hypothetical protein